MLGIGSLGWLEGVGWWPCWTCWCQRRTCTDSCVKHRSVNKREWFHLNKEVGLSDRSKRWWPNRRLHSWLLLQLKNKRPLVSPCEAPGPEGVPNRWVPLLMTQHVMPKADRHIIIDLVPPRQDLPKIFQKHKTGTWKHSFGGVVKRKPYLMNRLMGLNLSSPSRRDAFLVRVAPPTLSDVSTGKYY